MTASLPESVHATDPATPLGVGAGSLLTRSDIHPQIRRALSFIDQRLPDPYVNVATVARVLGLNPSYLSHLFAQEAGMRMGRYIATRRIHLAKELLATTDWQIKEIAFRSGHRSADWFSQVFRAQVGMTPGHYRQRILQGTRST